MGFKVLFLAVCAVLFAHEFALVCADSLAISEMSLLSRAKTGEELGQMLLGCEFAVWRRGQYLRLRGPFSWWGGYLYRFGTTVPQDVSPKQGGPWAPALCSMM